MKRIPISLRTIAHIVVLLSVALAISAIARELIRERGLHSGAAEPLIDAANFLQTGEWRQTAFYPPGMTLLAIGPVAIWRGGIDPFLFNLVLLLIAIPVVYALSMKIGLRSNLAFLAVLLILLNPYFVWTILLSRDSAGEFLATSLVLLLTISIIKRPSDFESKRFGIASVLLLGAVVLASLVRVSGFFIGLGVLIIAYIVLRRRNSRRSLVVPFVGLMLFALAFSYANYRQVGAFTLATNGGFNLYLGNHPAFLHGYPHYDIDDYLESQKIPAAEALPEVERDKAYREAAIGYVTGDPASFVLRSVMTSAWFWFSLDKLPNYTVDAAITSPPSDTNWEVQIGEINPYFSLANIAYRLFYIAGLIAAAIALQRKRLPAKWVVFFAPLLALWPVLVLTFPDSRFKLSAEALVVPLIVAAAVLLFVPSRVGSSLQSELA